MPVRSVTVVSATEEHPGELLVHFKEVPDYETANRLAGCHCLARRDDPTIAQILQKQTLTDADPTALFDGSQMAKSLLGYSVRTVEGKLIGVVSEVSITEFQTTLTVTEPSDTEHLVPLVEEFVVALDPQRKNLTMSLPDGLLDL